MKYKKGMVLQSRTSPVRIRLTSKHNGNGHWNSCKVGSTSSTQHRIHEGTLNKFYGVVTDE